MEGAGPAVVEGEGLGQGEFHRLHHVVMLGKMADPIPKTARIDGLSAQLPMLFQHIIQEELTSEVIVHD